MPIRSYRCNSCSFFLEDQLEWGFELKAHPCTKCAEVLHIVPSLPQVAPTTETLQYRDRKERFQKRNKRIEAMTPIQQDGFKKIVDDRNGQRYIP